MQKTFLLFGSLFCWISIASAVRYNSELIVLSPFDNQEFVPGDTILFDYVPIKKTIKHINIYLNSFGLEKSKMEIEIGADASEHPNGTYTLSGHTYKKFSLSYTLPEDLPTENESYQVAFYSAGGKILIGIDVHQPYDSKRRIRKRATSSSITYSPTQTQEEKEVSSKTTALSTNNSDKSVVTSLAEKGDEDDEESTTLPSKETENPISTSDVKSKKTTESTTTQTTFKVQPTSDPETTKKVSSDELTEKDEVPSTQKYSSLITKANTTTSEAPHKTLNKAKIPIESNMVKGKVEDSDSSSVEKENDDDFSSNDNETEDDENSSVTEKEDGEQDSSDDKDSQSVEILGGRPSHTSNIMNKSNSTHITDSSEGSIESNNTHIAVNKGSEKSTDTEATHTLTSSGLEIGNITALSDHSDNKKQDEDSSTPSDLEDENSEDTEFEDSEIETLNDSFSSDQSKSISNSTASLDDEESNVLPQGSSRSSEGGQDASLPRTLGMAGEVNDTLALNDVNTSSEATENLGSDDTTYVPLDIVNSTEGSNSSAFYTALYTSAAEVPISSIVSQVVSSTRATSSILSIPTIAMSDSGLNGSMSIASPSESSVSNSQSDATKKYGVNSLLLMIAIAILLHTQV